MLPNTSMHMQNSVQDESPLGIAFRHCSGVELLRKRLQRTEKNALGAPRLSGGSNKRRQRRGVELFTKVGSAGHVQINPTPSRQTTLIATGTMGVISQDIVSLPA